MWSETLLQASFKGIEFDIESVSDSVQRAAVSNEYPYRDGAEVEDLGLGAQRIRFTAIIFNARPRRGSEAAQDDYEARLAALLAALRSADAGRLVHPVFGSIDRAICTSWTVEHEAEFRDGCKLNLEFVESRAADRIFELIDREPLGRRIGIRQRHDPVFGSAQRGSGTAHRGDHGRREIVHGHPAGTRNIDARQRQRQRRRYVGRGRRIERRRRRQLGRIVRLK